MLLFNNQAHLSANKDACKKNPTDKKNIHLFQFSQDSLDLTYKCEECSCGEKKPKAEECSGKGNLTCGGCECETGYKGKINLNRHILTLIQINIKDQVLSN